jgi:putative spermidine/putrescine transport system ATP-binding protein
MSGGKIAQHGTPDELYFEPASEFVADFVGESNLFKGTLDAGLVVTTDTGLAVRVADGRGHAVGSAVKVLVRPEKIGVGEAPAGANAAMGIVELVSFVGGTTRFELKTERGAKILVTGISERSAKRIAVGDQVSVHWAAHDSIVLAQE